VSSADFAKDEKFRIFLITSLAALGAAGFAVATYFNK